MPDWIPLAVTAICSMLGAWVAIKVEIARFLAMDREREKHWTIWREDVERRIEKVILALPTSTQAVLNNRVDVHESEIRQLRSWKHERVDPHINAVQELKNRVDVLWRKIFDES